MYDAKCVFNKTYAHNKVFLFPSFAFEEITFLLHLQSDQIVAEGNIVFPLNLLPNDESITLLLN